MKDFIPLKDLEVYKLARKLSVIAWNVYEVLDWHDKKIMGDQFVESTDSVGVNIAEGYRRYHYLDRIKFYYNSRASLSESCDHWLELFHERNKIDKVKFDTFKSLVDKLSIKLNNFITSTYRLKSNKQNHSDHR
ncbi:MAG: four helix bundle protein [Candidatus Omnitrophota bacterium]|nr:four helix bundle protein [Candidatus Omnitrophota bacterium]